MLNGMILFFLFFVSTQQVFGMQKADLEQEKENNLQQTEENKRKRKKLEIEKPKEEEEEEEEENKEPEAKRQKKISVRNLPGNTLLTACDIFRKNHKNFLQETGAWLNDEMPDEDFFNNVAETGFVPFLRKIEFSAEEAKNKKIITFADLHGDIDSLNAMLKKLIDDNILNASEEISDPNTLIVFTGDFVDRGNFGVETFKKVIELTNKNPSNVYLCRGNHEDCEVNSRKHENYFEAQLCAKFSLKEKFYKKIFLEKVYGTYKFMPAALFVGVKNDDGITNYIKFCHGGYDLGVNPKNFLAASGKKFMRINNLPRLTNLEEIYNIHQDLPKEIGLDRLKRNYRAHLRNIEKLNSPGDCVIGEMWGDVHMFEKNCSPGILMTNENSRGHGCVEYSEKLVNLLRKAASSDTVKLIATIRGHQHDSLTIPAIIKEGGIHAAWQEEKTTNPNETPIKHDLNDAFLTIGPLPCPFADCYKDGLFAPFLIVHLDDLTYTKHNVKIAKPVVLSEKKGASIKKDSMKKACEMIDNHQQKKPASTCPCIIS